MFKIFNSILCYYYYYYIRYIELIMFSTNQYKTLTFFAPVFDMFDTYKICAIQNFA